MNKNKVLLSTIGLLVLSGVAATSTTFAWFTTVRTATLSYSNATVSSDSGNLNVTFKSSANGLNDSGAPNALVLSGINKVTDISGDGVNFFKPVWSATAGQASSITDVTATAEGFYVDFTLTIARDNNLALTGMKVYLGDNTSIKPVDAGAPADIAAVQAARMSVVNTADSVHILYAEEVETLAPTYITTAPTGTSAYGVDLFKIETAAAPITVRNGVPFATKGTIAAADADKAMIADLTSAVSKDVNFRFWIEGTDAQATNPAIGGIFSVDLNIYALEV